MRAVADVGRGWVIRLEGGGMENVDGISEARSSAEAI